MKYCFEKWTMHWVTERRDIEKEKNRKTIKTSYKDSNKKKTNN